MRGGKFRSLNSIIYGIISVSYLKLLIREYGSTLYIGIAMVFCVTFGPM